MIKPTLRQFVRNKFSMRKKQITAVRTSTNELFFSSVHRLFSYSVQLNEAGKAPVNDLRGNDDT